MTPGDWRGDRVILDLNENLGQAIRLAPYAAAGAKLRRFLHRAGRAIRDRELAPRAAATRACRSPQRWNGRRRVLLRLRRGSLEMDVAVRNTDSVIHRVGYHLSLYGSLVASVASPIAEPV